VVSPVKNGERKQLASHLQVLRIRVVLELKADDILNGVLHASIKKKAGAGMIAR